MRSHALVLAACLSLAPAAPATGQCRLCSGEQAASQDTPPASPMAIEVEASLDFDRLILVGPAGGTASLSPDGSRSTSGALAEMSGRAMVGGVVIRGEPNRAIRVDLPARIELFAPNGSRIVIREIASDLAANPRLDSAGRLQIRFGGSLDVAGDADGDYRGDVPITVEYL